MTHKALSSFTICHIFALEINYFPVLLSVRALLTRLPKRYKRKVVSGSRVTLPENFACKPGLSFNPLARVTLAVGLPYLLVNRALVSYAAVFWNVMQCSPQRRREHCVTPPKTAAKETMPVELGIFF